MKLVEKKEFIKKILDENFKKFVIYIVGLETLLAMSIYFSQLIQI